MNEAQLEQRAERMMDRLDARYLAGKLSDEEYDAAVRDIDDMMRTELNVISRRRNREHGWRAMEAHTNTDA